jgi:hypothetical protein
MNPTEEELKKIKVAAILSNDLDKYVYLRKDKKGFYIEYAFIKGVPHDNRCLSWYDSYQEKAYIRNEWVHGTISKEDIEYLAFIKKSRENRIGQLFILSSFTCGFEEDLEERLIESEKIWKNCYGNKEPFIPKDHICKVGHPAPKCRECQCKDWTYEEPVKCACWYLREPEVPSKVMIPIDVVIKLYDKNLI